MTQIQRLQDKYLPRFLGLLLCCFSFASYGQTYNPSVCCTVSNKSYGAAQSVSTDGRSWFYDASNFVMRDYNGTTEVFSYLNLPKYRSGHFPVFVHSGGILQVNGVWLGGSTLVYWFKDSTGNANLVRWYTDSTGVSGGPFYAIANNLSEGNAGLIKGNLALDLVNNTSDAQKNAASVALTNHTIDGSLNTLSNIPNSALSHNTIGLTLTATGSDVTIPVTPATLGNSLTINIPTATGSVRGVVIGADWSSFHGKVDSTTQSNDTVYDWHNGIAVFRYVIGGGGSGISSLNGLTTSTQFFATGTAGSDFNIVSSVATHTFNFPNSSGSNRGLLTAADWTDFSSKEPAITPSNTIDQYWNGYKQFVALNTDSITEGSNHLFFTNTRARAAISLTTIGSSGFSTYNNVTGVLNVPNYSGGGGSGITLPPLAWASNLSGSSATANDTSYYRVFNVLDFIPGFIDSVTDCTIGIQAAIDAASVSGHGGSVYIPAGRYIVSATIRTHPGQPIRIFGDGPPALTYEDNFANISNFGGSLFVFTSTTDTCIRNSANGTIMQDFGVKCNSTTFNTTNIGIYWDSTNECDSRNLLSQNFDQGFYWRQGVHYLFSRLKLADIHSVGYHSRSYDGLDAGDGRFEYGEGYATAQYSPHSGGIGFLIENGGGLKVLHSKLGRIFIPWTGFTDLDIEDNSIEAGTDCIDIVTQSGGSLANFKIINNQMISGGTHGILIDGSAAEIAHGIIDGNIINVQVGDTGLILKGDLNGVTVGPNNTIYSSGGTIIPVYSNITTPSNNSIAVKPQIHPFAEAAGHITLDLNFGTLFTGGIGTNNDTLDIINSGLANEFDIQAGTGVTVTNIVLGSGNFNYSSDNAFYVGVQPGVTNIIHCVSIDPNHFIVKGVDHQYVNGAIPVYNNGHRSDSSFTWNDATHPGTLKINATSTTLGGISLDGFSDPAIILKNNGLPYGYVGTLSSNGAVFTDGLVGDMILDDPGHRILLGGGSGGPSTMKVDGTSVGIGAFFADASAILNVTSTTAGVLLPRMNTTQQNAIPFPLTGVIIYNTDSAGLVDYNGAAWLRERPAVSSGTYSPTFTNVTNITSSTPLAVSFYSKVGNIIHVMVEGTVTPTIAGAVNMKISLPFNANTSSQGVIGQITAFTSVPVFQQGYISGSATANVCELNLVATSGSALTFTCSFDYSL